MLGPLLQIQYSVMEFSALVLPKHWHDIHWTLILVDFVHSEPQSWAVQSIYKATLTSDFIHVRPMYLSHWKKDPILNVEPSSPLSNASVLEANFSRTPPQSDTHPSFASKPDFFDAILAELPVEQNRKSIT